MAKLIRFLTRRKKTNKRDYVDSSMDRRLKETDIECKIVHLDGTDFTVFLEKRALGQKLEEYAFNLIDLNDDRNYFGLQYTDKKNINHWLDIDKKVSKQCEIGPPFTLRFRVKFFSSDPCTTLQDEHTRYLFTLQLKELLRNGELSCEDMELASDIAALSLQSELGDYDEDIHTPSYISQYRFLPDSVQTEEFELMVLSKYIKMKDRNLNPAIADRQYLEKCRSLPDYGVDRHNIKGKNDKDYVLGLTPSGILIYEGGTKIGLFPWSSVTKLSFKKSRFKIVVLDNQEDNEGNLEHTFVFQTLDVSACKQMWKSCVEHHAFFRLEGVRKPPTKFQQIFRLKSRFYASFHTEYQMAMRTNYGTSARRSSTFTRKPSLRMAPRASFERNEMERRRIQQKNREKVREENKLAAIQRLNSQNHPGSIPSTPSSGSTSGYSKSPFTPTKANLSANMQYRNPPRILAQNSVTSASSIEKQESAESSTSGSSEEMNHVAKPVPKPKPNYPVVPAKPTSARPMLNNGNQRNYVSSQSDSSDSSNDDENDTDEGEHNGGDNGGHYNDDRSPPNISGRPTNAPLPQPRVMKQPPRPSNYRNLNSDQIIQV